MIKDIQKILLLLPPKDKLKLVVLFVMMLIGAVLEVIGIGMIPVFVSIIASPDKVLEIELLKGVWDYFGIETAGDLLIYGSVILIGVFVIKNSYVIFYKYIQSRFVWSRFASIGGNLFKEYMLAPYEFHISRNTSELLRNVTQEAQYLAKNVMMPLLKLGMDLILIIAIFITLFIVEPLITLIVIILLGGAGGLFLQLIRSKTKMYGKTGQTDREFMIRSVNEGLGGLKDARVLNRERWFYKRFKKHIKSYGKSQTYREVASMATKPVIETIAVFGMLFIALVLYLQGRGIETVIPILALFGAATIRLMPAIKGCTTAITNLRYYLYTVDPIYNDTQVLKRSDDKLNISQDGTQQKDKLILKNSIEFNRVSYSYPDSDLKALDDLSINIPIGSSVGFVGTSGAGKTTLVDTLLGLLVPQKGKITVDGVDINANLQGWKKNIGYIPQFIFLADASIKNNIALGLPDEKINEEKISNAIKAAQLTELIESLPDGIDTIIGEHGTKLSGGQRQRLGIARALYQNPQVLIMDEATSALDNNTERSVTAAIEKLRGDRTIIIIAHRLTTVKNCDKLYVMKSGKIISEGSYSYLLQESKEFRSIASEIA